MARHRDDLPQLGDDLFLTDSGLETDLIFNLGFSLPDFAAFPLLDSKAGETALFDYYRDHAELAADQGVGIVMETPTWRASADWGSRIGFDEPALAEQNRKAVALVHQVRAERERVAPPLVISGSIGPRGDAYNPEAVMDREAARRYHSQQIETFADTDVDLVAALTLTSIEEAIGIVRAASAAGLPSVISFTVETDGRLPDGTTVLDAITIVDDATGAAPAYYMINCAHPVHLELAVTEAAASSRLRGVRANASTKSHAELDESVALDDGDPIQLGVQMAELRQENRNLTIMGGCCGTDVRHIAAIADQMT